MADEKQLNNTLSQIEKQFGEGSIMRLGDKAATKIPCISTGSLSIDLALGGSGVPRGRIIEIYGPESSGKTTVSLHVIAEAQKVGGVAAFIDAEHALDPSWAKRVGVDLESLLVSQPNHGEEALKIAEMLIKSNAVDVIVLDSVAALVPKSEVNGEIGESRVGEQARLMSQALRMLNPIIHKTKTSMIFINQIRQKIGVMFGNPETTSGGLALKFYTSVRMEVRKITTIKESDETIGNRVRVRVVKNKIAPPFRNAEVDLMYNEGISSEGDLLDLGIADKIIEKSGAWLSYNGEKLGQGREKAKQELRANKALYEEIRDKIIAKRMPEEQEPQAVEESEGPAELPPPEEEPVDTAPKSKKKTASK